ATVRIEQCRDPITEIRVDEVTRRDIDRNVHRQPALAPGGALRNRFVEHPVGNGADVSGLLGEPDELVGRHDTACWMAPTYQRFYIVLVAASESDFRLVLEHELSVLERGAQVAHQRQPLTAVAIVSIV